MSHPTFPISHLLFFRHHLLQIAARWPLSLDGGAVALDVGASPGGWSSYLASAGCGRVIAVDPGALELGALSEAQRAAIEHMPLKAQEAVPVLIERRERIDFYCCDMNVEPAVVVSILFETMPLLKTGAKVAPTDTPPLFANHRDVSLSCL